jgi:hypothetical protein
MAAAICLAKKVERRQKEKMEESKKMDGRRKINEISVRELSD